MRESIPFLVFGDGPRLSSGLARIARDLSLRLATHAEDLGIRFAQIGVDFPSGWHWQPWDFFGFQPVKGADQGRDAVREVVREFHAEHGQEPIILAVMDPNRLYDLTRTQMDGEHGGEIETERIWGYLPIDAHNPRGQLDGPASAAIATCERVLGYGRYGAGVLNQTLASAPGYTGSTTVPYLPHGIDLGVFHPKQRDPDRLFAEWQAGLPTGALIIGCVATNQPRKDYGLLFSTVAALKTRGYPVGLWIVTDMWTNAWDMGELAYQFRLGREEVCVLVTGLASDLTDAQLAARYALSDVTIAPGLGEGFGYPIVESLACGTPVIHGHYAGGVELLPDARWLVRPTAWRLESAYVLQRPVFRPAEMADAVLRATTRASGLPGRVSAAYCHGAVAHLDWRVLWPRWQAWIQKGLHPHGHRRATESLQPVEAGSDRVGPEPV